MSTAVDLLAQFAASFDAAAGHIEHIMLRALNLLGFGLLVYQFIRAILRSLRRKRH